MTITLSDQEATYLGALLACKTPLVPREQQALDYLAVVLLAPKSRYVREAAILHAYLDKCLAEQNGDVWRLR